MRWRPLGLVIASASLIGAARAAESQDDPRCARLISASHPLIQILSAIRVPAGGFEAAPNQVIRVPASCRVVAVAMPTRDSRIGFELWLPDNWNGRYVQLGNGGFAGNIDHPSLAAEIRRGNAAAMTDTGHKASQFDASWALGHPEKVIDYGYRSIKVVSDAAKALISDHYGIAPRRRYFVGCSNGGRQALMAAQRYPLDWDGIIAGSPALQWTRQLAAFAAIQHRLRSRGDNWIPAAKLPLIQREAERTCMPGKLGCRIEVRRLICRRADGSTCLTRSQATTLDVIQSGAGSYPGFEPTGAGVPRNWDQWIINPDGEVPQLAFTTSFYRYLVHHQPSWRVEEFDSRHDIALASARMIRGQSLAAIINADNPDLRPFGGHGGKLIMYVGTADALVAPSSGISYYRAVTKRMGGAARTQNFFRLFVIPGMQHCQGGLTPNAFGQAWIAPAVQSDPDHDIRLALEAWVERGKSPRRLVVAKYARDHISPELLSTRRISPYPEAPEAIRALY